jgi:hypothetical protein
MLRFLSVIKSPNGTKFQRFKIQRFDYAAPQADDAVAGEVF